MQNVQDRLDGIVAKLNEQSLKFGKEASNGQSRASSEQLQDKGHLSEQGQLGLDPMDHAAPCPDVQPAAESSSKLEEKENEAVVEAKDEDGAPPGNQRENSEERPEETKDGGLTTVG